MAIEHKLGAIWSSGMIPCTETFLMLKCKLLQACLELLEEENVEIPTWICFSSVDGEHAPSGESFDECLEIINKSSKVTAVGINCAPPHFVQSLIQKFSKVYTLLLHVFLSFYLNPYMLHFISHLISHVCGLFSLSVNKKDHSCVSQQRGDMGRHSKEMAGM